MKNLISSLFLLLALYLLTLGCKKHEEDLKANTFLHQWFSLDSRLKINSDKTFEYVRSSCLHPSISKGNWKIVNDTLILNSFTPKGCYIDESFIISPPDTMKGVKKTTPKCSPNQGYVKFKNDTFYIKDSTLVYKTSLNINNDGLNPIYNFKRKSYYK